MTHYDVRVAILDVNINLAFKKFVLPSNAISGNGVHEVHCNDAHV